MSEKTKLVMSCGCVLLSLVAIAMIVVTIIHPVNHILPIGLGMIVISQIIVLVSINSKNREDIFDEGNRQTR